MSADRTLVPGLRGCLELTVGTIITDIAKVGGVYWGEATVAESIRALLDVMLFFNLLQALNYITSFEVSW